MQGLSLGGGTSRAPTRLRRPTSNVQSHPAVHMRRVRQMDRNERYRSAKS